MNKIEPEHRDAAYKLADKVGAKVIRMTTEEYHLLSKDFSKILADAFPLAPLTEEQEAVIAQLDDRVNFKERAAPGRMKTGLDFERALRSIIHQLRLQVQGGEETEMLKNALKDTRAVVIALLQRMEEIDEVRPPRDGSKGWFWESCGEEIAGVLWDVTKDFPEPPKEGETKSRKLCEEEGCSEIATRMGPPGIGNLCTKHYEALGDWGEPKPSA